MPLVELYYFECGLKIWSVSTTFWDVKKIISRWILYLILFRLKWVVLYSCEPNMTRLLSVSNELGQVNPPYSQVRLRLKDHDTIIKWVGLGLSHLVEYPYLNTTRTRHANPNWHPYLVPALYRPYRLISGNTDRY